MKASKIILGLSILITSAASAAYAQQQFTQTVTTQIKNCNATCSVIDVPDLNSNPAAVIFVTPVLVNGTNLNPHPIGAYYMYLNKWSVFNLDGIALAVGAKFNVEYYVSPDSDHFVYVVPQRVHLTDVSYIDHLGLNNSPNAQIRAFPHVSSTIGNIWNKYDVKVEYDAAASKWFIANVNNTAVPSDSAYDIMFSGGNPIIANPKPPIVGSCNCVTPNSLPPNGSAGGDLSETYPYPKVSGLQGKPLSSDPPAVGQVLIWNGSAWEPANDIVSNSGSVGATYNAGTGLSLSGSTFNASTNSQMWNANQIASRPISNTSPTVGQILKWNGTAWAPAAENVAPFQTIFKNPPPTTKTIGQLELSDNRPTVDLSELSHTIILDKKSRLVISATIGFSGPFCILGCVDAEGDFVIRINNNGINSTRTIFRVGNNKLGSANISNYMIDLDPGTYNVEFIVSDRK